MRLSPSWLCLVVLLCAVSGGVTLMLRDSPDRPVKLYRAPTPYFTQGKPSLSSVIITSKPLDFTTTTTTPRPSWRRHSTPEDEDEDITPRLPLTRVRTVDFVTNSRRFSDHKNNELRGSEFKGYDHRESGHGHQDSGDHHKTYEQKKSEHRESDHKDSNPGSDHTNSSVNIPFYNFECRKGEICSETINLELSTPSPTFKPYSQEMLDKFLKDFTKKHQKLGDQEKLPPRMLTRYNDRELVEPVEQPTNRLANLYLENEDAAEGESEDKPTWDLVPAEKHHHPYDDHDGWITLEPVPWSSSKVAKWHSLVKPNKRPQWEENQRPSRPTKPWDNGNQWDNKPAYDWDSDRPSKPWDNDKPSKPWEDKPFYKPWNDRPTKPWDNDRLHNDKPGRPLHWASSGDIITADSRPHAGSGRPQQWGHRPNKWGSAVDIITADDGPAQWPGAQRPQSEGHHSNSHHHHPSQQQWPGRPHPQNHPENGPGEWVLLSSTKGYSLPSRSRSSRQRAMTIMTSSPINTKRTVRLTVLPADPENTAISHGGLLEVEKTFQTVDESHEQDRISRYQTGKLSDKDAERINQSVQQNFTTSDMSANMTELNADQVLFTTNPTDPPSKQELSQDLSATYVRSPDNRKTATLAAVGAGIVPATMALLVPLMLGRRKREVDTHANTSSFLNTLAQRVR